MIPVVFNLKALGRYAAIKPKQTVLRSLPPHLFGQWDFSVAYRTNLERN